MDSQRRQAIPGFLSVELVCRNDVVRRHGTRSVACLRLKSDQVLLSRLLHCWRVGVKPTPDVVSKLLDSSPFHHHYKHGQRKRFQSAFEENVFFKSE